MKITFALLTVALVGCFSPVEREAEDIQDKAQDIVHEARDVERAERPGEEMEQRIDLAQAREDLAGEFREMAEARGEYQERELTDEARQALTNLQKRYMDLAQQMEAAGTDPEVLRRLKNEVETLSTDIDTDGRDAGT